MKSEDGGGVVLGGEFFLTSEDQGADVAGVETGDDGLGTVVGRCSWRGGRGLSRVVRQDLSE